MRNPWLTRIIGALSRCVSSAWNGPRGALWGLGAVLLGTGLLGACQSVGPTEALLQYLDALSGPQAEAPYRMLSRDTREHLGALAADLRTRSGGAVDRQPHELLSYLSIGMKRDARSIALVRQEADAAVLRVTLERGGTDEVTLRREDGTWRIELAGLGRAARQPAALPTAPVAAPAK